MDKFTPDKLRKCADGLKPGLCGSDILRVSGTANVIEALKWAAQEIECLNMHIRRLGSELRILQRYAVNSDTYTTQYDGKWVLWDDIQSFLND